LNISLQWWYIDRGQVTPLSSDLEQQLFNTPEKQALRQDFYPFYLTKGDFRTRGYIAIAGFLVFGFFLIKISLPNWRYLQNPMTIPVIKKVSNWGDIYSISADIEREFHNPQLRGENNWKLTDKYLIKSGFFSFNLLRIIDLLWAYKRVTKHSVNFIPTGKTYEAVLVCNGGKASIKGSDDLINAILQFVGKRAPWAIFGYSRELANLFKGKTKEFFLEVEKRKQAILSEAR
jgi:hypothetical protein